MFYKCLFSALCFLGVYAMDAQLNETALRQHYWMQSALGTGNSDMGYEFSLHADLNKFYLSLAFNGYHEEFLILGPPSKVYQSFSLRAGRLYRHKAFTFGYSGGLGLGQEKTPVRTGAGEFLFYSYRYERKNVWDVTLQAMAGLRILEIAMLNISVGAQINPEFPQAYVRLGFGLGKFF